MQGGKPPHHEAARSKGGRPTNNARGDIPGSSGRRHGHSIPAGRLAAPEVAAARPSQSEQTAAAHNGWRDLLMSDYERNAWRGLVEVSCLIVGMLALGWVAS